MHCDTRDCDISDHMLTLNRPDKLDPFHGPMMNELLHAFDAADAGGLAWRHEPSDRAIRPDGAAPGEPRRELARRRL